MAKIQKKERHVVIEWGDVRDQILKVVGEGVAWEKASKYSGLNKNHDTARQMMAAAEDPYGPPKCNPKGYGHNQSRCKRCRWEQKHKWAGGNWGQTMDWLRNGFRAPEFRHSAEYVPMARRPRPQWNEEPDGDLDLGRLYGGYDNPYLVHSEAERKPGIRMMIEFAFAAGVRQETIQEYGAWVAGLIGSLESSGYDMTIDLWIPLDDLFHEKKDGYDFWGGGGTRDNILMRVKRENEVADFTNWSALFGPTGYRHVGFCAKLVAADKLNMYAANYLGMTLAGQGWDLDYDKENSILKIRVDQRGSEWFNGNRFPKDTLNQKAYELGLIPEVVKA